MIGNAITDHRFAPPHVEGRHNILIAGPGTGAQVRYSYSPLTARRTEDDADGYTRDYDEQGRLIAVWVPRLPDVFRADVINNLGRPGAYCQQTNWPGLAAAVAELRDEWGNIVCQINADLPAGAPA